VNFGHYAHPEFGSLCPAPRMRRELGVAFFAALFGAAMGAVGVIALTASDREGNSASATQAPAIATVSEPRKRYAGVNASGLDSADMGSNKCCA
jgi:anti-sigma factor RsiW